MRILFIGDIVGRPGRDAVRRWVPVLRDELGVDIVIANGENSAGGVGATRDTVREILGAGVHAITMGNHTWRKREFVGDIESLGPVVRPANYPEGTPGKGSQCVELDDGRCVGVVNVLGRVYMEPFGCPFEAAEREVKALKHEAKIILVDVHAEATSEKAALGWYLDGMCTAVVGTHTHVPTADEQILPKGTAFITDVGMTGPEHSAIGVDFEPVIYKFTTGIPAPFTVSKNPAILNGVIIEADDSNGSAIRIERVQRKGA
jgi:2',3'-cyclic-nucleotide 2'-phosphodiesterase